MKTKQTGFAFVESVIIFLYVIVIGVGIYLVWHNENSKNKPAATSDQASTSSIATYTDSAGAFSLKYSNDWEFKYIDPAGTDSPVPTPDYSKQSRPFTLLPPHNQKNQLNIQFGAADAIPNDKARADKFHTIKELTINGQQAILDKLVFTGPSAAEKYTDDTYIITSGSFSISLTFRENYYHDSPYENWSDSQDLAGFESIVNSIKISGASSSASQSASSKTSSSSSSTSSTEYFTISQWGVRAPYSGNLTLEYSLNSSDSLPWVGTFSSTQLDATSAQCANKTYGGSIDRYRSTDVVRLADGTSSGQTAAEYATTLSKSDYGHAGDYYYFFQHAQSACGDNQASSNVETQTNNAVKALLPNLQVIPQ
ncbi:MAG TPA: hypothetical protein VFT49_00790 [Candidatus Saccharimonadales bacterium]|nr:hypothetical protein [Candidatus Saccharimonadales bacterium]